MLSTLSLIFFKTGSVKFIKLKKKVQYETFQIIGKVQFLKVFLSSFCWKLQISPPLPPNSSLFARSNKSKSEIVAQIKTCAMQQFVGSYRCALIFISSPIFFFFFYNFIVCFFRHFVLANLNITAKAVKVGESSFKDGTREKNFSAVFLSLSPFNLFAN